MLDNKIGQIGETVTWVVATLIIIVILSISVLATVSISNKQLIFLEDKEKDFIATKSIISFLKNPDNIELLVSGDEKKIESEMESFLNILPTSKPIIVGVRSILGVESFSRRGVSKWFFDIGEDDENLPFEVKFSSDKIKLRFWANCYDAGCR